MHRQNFDTGSERSYPLTIDRLAEMQGDLQVPLKILAGMLPEGDCILSGCESVGDAGYVLTDLGGTYEVLEVREGSGTYLELKSESITATNAEGETVTVRVERWLDWTDTKGSNLAYSGLPRLWLRKASQNDAEWQAVGEGTQWQAFATGARPRVQRTNGRIHLWGEVTYAVKLNNVWTATNLVKQDLLADGTLVLFESSDTFRLPTGYRPAGDVLVPIRYNGVPGTALLTSAGQLLLGRDTEVGDVLKIDTWFEI